MAPRSRGSSLRPLGRLLDASPQPVWVFNPAGELVYVSAACGRWLQVDPESLIAAGPRRGPTASDRSDVPDGTPHAAHREALVQALSPPPGLAERRQLLHRIQLPRSPGAAPADASATAEEASIACFLAFDTADGLFVLGSLGPFISGPSRPIFRPDC